MHRKRNFNYFYCMEICDILSRDLDMLTYTYLNVNDCWLTSSMSQQRFKLQLLLNCNSRKCHFWRLVVEMNWFLFTYILANLITNSIHAWLTNYYRWSGMCHQKTTNTTVILQNLSWLQAWIGLSNKECTCTYVYPYHIKTGLKIWSVSIHAYAYPSSV